MFEGWNPIRLKEAMVLRGLSNQMLAKELNVNWLTVGRWKSIYSDKAPSPEELWKIAQITGFPIRHFITKDKHEVKSLGIFY